MKQKRKSIKFEVTIEYVNGDTITKTMTKTQLQAIIQTDIFNFDPINSITYRRVIEMT